MRPPSIARRAATERQPAPLWHALTGLGLTLAAGLLSGCRLAPSIDGFREGLAAHPGRGCLLADVPFQAQAPERCAQAALASVLSFHGQEQSASEPAGDAYLTGLGGTPTFALVEVGRQLGFATRELERVDLAALLLWLDAALPVITLRATRSGLATALHYDVLVGYDDAAGLLVRHDGARPFQVVTYERFLREWTGWALVLVPPAVVAPAEEAEAAARAGRLAEARRLYRAYLRRCPGDLIAAFNLADLEEPDEAARIYEAILRLSPDDGPTLNNLACLLGRSAATRPRAEQLLEHAVAVDPANAASYRESLEEIRAGHQQSPRPSG